MEAGDKKLKPPPDSSLLALKIARHSPCSRCPTCPGLHPPSGIDVVVDGQSDSSLGDLGQYGSDDEDDPPSSYLSSCACGHGVNEHNADEKELGRVEFSRRARVAIRLDELLQDSGRLPDFDYTDEDISSLRKQMGHAISGISLVTVNSSPAGGAVPAPLSEDNNSTAPTSNGKVNGINGHEPRIKQEDKMDEGQLNRLTAGIPMDTVGRSSAGPPVRTEKPSAVELRKGVIQITAVENDKQARSLIILTGLKTLFQKQLPKMPREYIARLVFDTNSKSLAIIKRGYKVVGGICYRPFSQRGFAEIVFFATNSADQEKGYGGMLMDHFKAHIRKAYPDMMHFLTYADNYAVGYFEKQGFSKDISLDRSVWAGYIKDYEGGTIMQCTMLPKIDYLDKPSIFKQQTEAILTKIRQKSTSHIVYPGLPQFQPGASPGIIVDPKSVPGLRETGWTPEMAALLARAPVKPSTRTTMEKIMSEMIEEPRGWAFRKPVDTTDVADYFDIIKHPMDFSTIQHKISTNQYKSFEGFQEDVQLVFDNCRLYNPENTIYAKNARFMDQFFKQLLSKYLASDKQEKQGK
ncbi:hypothetical protein CVT25_014114 [Psilocybe cyanescens]|uniref:histone acetyltransferase n=1 Tax=Psilocybe cyanescens TaxID=93625 RepID=A0A409XG03_PSICY|nr:hypothetical protein CVT25_014114 [Psilocybe cyanescens]